MRVPHHHAHHLNLGVGVPTVLAGLRDNYSAPSEATPEAEEEPVDLTLNARQGKQAETEAENAERFPERIDNDQAVDEVLAAASPTDQVDESIERQEVREGKQLLKHHGGSLNETKEKMPCLIKTMPSRYVRTHIPTK